MATVIPKRNVSEPVTYTLSRQDTPEELKYQEHDQELRIIDASAVLSTDAAGYIYDENDKRAYPSMTQGPWVITNSEDRARHSRGFTNPNLHRMLDAQMPDDELEILPRSYEVDLMNVNSYRNTKYHTHVDYQDLEKYLQDHPNIDADVLTEIRERADAGERREIP